MQKSDPERSKGQPVIRNYLCYLVYINKYVIIHDREENISQQKICRNVIHVYEKLELESKMVRVIVHAKVPSKLRATIITMAI